VMVIHVHAEYGELSAPATLFRDGAEASLEARICLPGSWGSQSIAYSTDRGHPFQADHGQRSGRSRTPWVGCLSDCLDRNESVRHHGGTLCASCGSEGPGYPRGALVPGG
jgi:hypothetical protein